MTYTLTNPLSRLEMWNYNDFIKTVGERKPLTGKQKKKAIKKREKAKASRKLNRK